MQRNTFALLASALILGISSLATIAGDAKDKPSDKKAIQGTWTFTKGNEKIQLALTGNKFTLDFKGKTVSGTFSLDPTQKPHTIDMTVTEASDDDNAKFKGKVSKGIYELDGDQLKWLANEPGKEDRPKAFPAAGESPKSLYVTFDRVKK
jgi:uncharacterized protein (TIGR03067 family)